MKNIIKTELIQKYIEENNITKTNFCKQCKISISTLNLLLKNKAKTKIETLIKISKSTKITIDELLGLNFPKPKKKAWQKSDFY